MHYRVPLLEDGVELYEMRSLLGNARGSGQTTAMSRFGNYALHAKLFVFDRQKLFIGSMNFDQRSKHLNTEIGLIIDSPELAQQIAARFEAMVQPANAYMLVLRADDDAGRPPQPDVAHRRKTARPVEYDTEPARSDWQRFEVNCCRCCHWTGSYEHAIDNGFDAGRGTTAGAGRACGARRQGCNWKSIFCWAISRAPDARSIATAAGTTRKRHKNTYATSTSILVARDQINTTEEFIEKAATESSFSGQAYEVKCNSGPSGTSNQWLRDELARLRTYQDC